MGSMSARDWRFIVFICLLIGAPFSKYPSIAIPLFNFPSFRIGAYQLVATIFVLLCVKPMYHAGATFFNTYHKLTFYALAVFSALTAISVLWSLYPARSALLAVSVLMLVAIILAGWWFAANELSNKRKIIMVHALLYASIGFGIIALIQLVIFTLTNSTLGVLCPGCTAEVFGFPRVNGLAAEPQFFANAMIPFVFAALYSVVKSPNKLGWAALVASVGTIGLTFSRGAYVALAISLLAVAIALYARKLTSLKTIMISYGVIALSIIGSLVLLVTAATIRYNGTPDITYQTVDSITEHLTVGVIDLPDPTPVPQQAPSEASQDKFVSPGLIEASGNERLSAAELALSAWRDTPLTFLFGVGAGNLGPYVVANIEPTAPDNLTVYIYYILLLAELGIIGLTAIVIVFGSAIKALARYSSLEAVMMNGRLGAFALQFFFFGSYINVVYIWLWIGIALGITSVANVPKKAPKKV